MVWNEQAGVVADGEARTRAGAQGPGTRVVTNSRWKCGARVILNLLDFAYEAFIIHDYRFFTNTFKSEYSFVKAIQERRVNITDLAIDCAQKKYFYT